MRRSQRDPTANLGDGDGLVQFNKRSREITFECWPRHANLTDGDAAQYPGWPITVRMDDNDGRRIFGYLPELTVLEFSNPVVQVVREADGEILYTLRIQGHQFRPPVHGPGTCTVKVGRNLPDAWSIGGLEPR